MSSRYFKAPIPDIGFDDAATLFATYKDNYNTADSNFTFTGTPVTTNELEISGLRGGGNWNFIGLDVDGDVSIQDCVNTTITGGQVNAWDQNSGSVSYSGTTVGSNIPSADEAHYKIRGGSATIESGAVIDHTSPSNYSIGTIGNDKTFITVIPGFTKIGAPIIADLVAGPRGEIYYAGDLISDVVTVDFSSTGTIRDAVNGIFTGGPISGDGSLIDTRFFVSTLDDTTVSLTPVETSLEITYTPRSPTNRIVVTASFCSQSIRISGTQADRYGEFFINRTTGTPATISNCKVGRTLTNINNDSSPSFSYQTMRATEIAGDTTPHRYVVAFSTPDVEVQNSLLGSSGTQAVICVQEYFDDGIIPPQEDQWVTDEQEPMISDAADDIIFV